jgi:hypothetical protein
MTWAKALDYLLNITRESMWNWSQQSNGSATSRAWLTQELENRTRGEGLFARGNRRTDLIVDVDAECSAR